MAHQIMLVMVLVASAILLPSAQAFKDPHNVFCGDEDCYKVLGLEPGADKADIKKAYRSISLDVHPDKNQNPEAKERFTVRAGVLLPPEARIDGYSGERVAARRIWYNIRSTIVLIITYKKV